MPNPQTKTIYYMPRVSIQHFRNTLHPLAKSKDIEFSEQFDYLAKSLYDQLIRREYIQINQMCFFDFHQKAPQIGLPVACEH